MIILALVVCLAMIELAVGESSYPGLHLPIYRRGRRLIHHETANLTTLAAVLQTAEFQYSRVHCTVENNRIKRHWKNSAVEESLFTTVGSIGQWYANIDIGNPPQTLEFDIDMLSPDFYVLMTTSQNGLKYDSFTSTSHEANDERVHSLCRRPSDIFRFPSPFGSSRQPFAMCSPHKSSRHTLSSSGAVIGLGPSQNLARLSMPTFVDQLVTSGVFRNNIWSLTLLDADTGILSLGGTLHEEFERAKVQGDIELKHFGDPMATPEWIAQQVSNYMQFSMPSDSYYSDHYKWAAVKGAEGWWTTLMSGVWVNGVKVLKNQPVLLDVNCPFVLAPPLAAEQFYEGISGSKRLLPPHDNFFAFPCLNAPSIVFELAGWNFPALTGEGTRADALHGPAGGRFSLGNLAPGSGYCVGIVVESRMRLYKDWSTSGMQEVWVLGELFFRGLGVVFDAEEGRIGFRTY